MITVMLSGTLAKPPETRTSAKGTSYTMATLKVQTPDGDLFATVFAFDPLAGTLAELGKADSVTVVGIHKLLDLLARSVTRSAGVPASGIQHALDQLSL